MRPSVVVLSATLPVVSAADVAAVLIAHGEASGGLAVAVGLGETDRARPVLAAGASTVLSRPYRRRELEALLHAHLVRPGHPRGQAVLSVGVLHLDGPAFQASAAGRPMRLTLREFELLRLLMVHAGKVVSPEHIRSVLWEARGESVSANTIAVHIRHLRAHLDGVADILTVRGVGYRLVVPGMDAVAGHRPADETTRGERTG
jgi:DNA-binding response OmpR family regulator